RFAPAAADVEHAHAGREAKLAEHEVEFRLLRIVEVRRLVPVAAAVDEPLAEHRLEKIVAEIVVALADDIRAASVLQVEEARLHVQPRIVESAHALVETRV